MFPSALTEGYGLRSSRPRRKVPVWNSGALVSLFEELLHWSYPRKTHSPDFVAMYDAAVRNGELHLQTLN